ncbi:hypothetical protein NDU88_003737 [Pleurodeles waltl]|uniref:Uncharacterized protein n=1 Tax=Pleurodeles waltl TaxID=8319 RepID=A0AAV7PE07_PLEWA|nr:hypothetical protein NDU88_003737 [Pleurodeles waltl]
MTAWKEKAREKDKKKERSREGQGKKENKRKGKGKERKEKKKEKGQRKKEIKKIAVQTDETRPRNTCARTRNPEPETSDRIRKTPGDAVEHRRSRSRRLQRCARHNIRTVRPDPRGVPRQTGSRSTRHGNWPLGL